METGDLIFVRGHSLISNIVRAVDKGEFSHVAMAVSPTHVIEAEWSTKSVITPVHYEDYEVVSLDLTEEQKDIIIKKAIQLTGRWYDYPQALGYLFSRKWGSPKNLVCSEIVYLLLKEIGLDLGNPDVTPNELYQGITLSQAM